MNLFNPPPHSLSPSFFLFQSIFLYPSCSSHHFLMIFLFLEKPFKKKRHRSQDFLFSSSWLPNIGKQGMQTWCNNFLNFLHNTSDYLRTTKLPIYCFSLLSTFPGLIVMETGERKKQTVNTTNLRQPRRLLMLNLLKTRPSFSSPPNLHFHFSVLCCFLQVKSFYSDSGLFICGL